MPATEVAVGDEIMLIQVRPHGEKACLKSSQFEAIRAVWLADSPYLLR